MTKEINELNLPDELHYTKDHEWVRLEDDHAKVGLDDYAQDQLGDIVFVELPEKGATFKSGEVFATVESVKAVSDCYLPISGEIIHVNIELEDGPELINNDPYEKGWFVVLKPSDISEMKNLMDSAACRDSLLKGE